MPEEYFWHWHVWFFPIVMPIFWVVVITVALFLIFGRRGFRRPGGPNQDRESALEILKKRYARGEISKDEFERMKRDILG